MTEGSLGIDFVPPRRKSKEISIDEAGRIIAGASRIHIMNNAVALARAAIRAGAKNLTVIPQVTSSMSTDLLVAGGAVGTLYISYIGFETFGFAPAFRKAAQDKSINIIESDEAFLMLGARAAAGGMSFVPIANVYEANDLPKYNKELRKVTDPFTGQEMYAIPPLRADVCLIHVQECDEYGNAQCWGGNQQEIDKAMASDHVIVTTDRLVSVERTKEYPDRVTLPGHLVHSVVHSPYGAHPLQSAKQYDQDDAHIRSYFDAHAKGEIAAYLDRYVTGVKDEFEYLERVGLRNLLRLTRKI